MIPDRLIWILFRRRQIAKRIRGFRAHISSYATQDCQFEEYVNLHSGSCIYSSQIGRASYITDATLSKVITGKFCSIGQGAKIGLGRHPTNFLSTHPAFYSSGDQTLLHIAKIPDFDELSPVVLGNDVWIGANSLLMSGVSVGDGAVIGAGAIVTKDIPPYAIAVGSPARVFRYRFDEKTVSMLLKLQWWNKLDKEIETIFKTISPNGSIQPLELERLMSNNISLK
ncbi:MAG TPA: CatB-related O-acetyltransferase [Methylotenera sp.]|nr:CatB-related O-acetyltransferase [Methylotenera sp.]HPM49013.1 CatB-related O-acetyltransferase [Methylotenera sp.]